METMMHTLGRVMMLGLLVGMGCTGGPPAAEDGAEHHARMDAVLKALVDQDTSAQAALMVPGATLHGPRGIPLERSGEARMHHGAVFAPVKADGKRALMLVLVNTEGLIERGVVVMEDGDGAVTSQVKAYQDAWNERGDTERAPMLKAGFSEQGRYLDPGTDAAGRSALDEAIVEYQRSPAGWGTMTAVPAVGHQDGWVWFPWTIFAPGGARLQDGFDVAHAGPDGTLDLVVGFFEKSP